MFTSKWSFIEWPSEYFNILILSDVLIQAASIAVDTFNFKCSIYSLITTPIYSHALIKASCISLLPLCKFKFKDLKLSKKGLILF